MSSLLREEVPVSVFVSLGFIGKELECDPGLLPVFSWRYPGNFTDILGILFGGGVCWALSVVVIVCMFESFVVVLYGVSPFGQFWGCCQTTSGIIGRDIFNFFPGTSVCDSE